MLGKISMVRVFFKGKNSAKLTALAKKYGQTRTAYLSELINNHLDKKYFPRKRQKGAK